MKKKHPQKKRKYKWEHYGDVKKNRDDTQQNQCNILDGVKKLTTNVDKTSPRKDFMY